MLGAQALGRLALGQATTPHAIVAAAGMFTLSGQAAGLRIAMPGSYASFALTGQAATLTYLSGANLAASAGSLTITGQAAGLALKMPGATGSFAVSGQSTRRLLSLRGETGSLAVAGQSAVLRRGLVLYAFGSLNARREHVLFAPLGAVALGQSASNLPGQALFSLTGQAASFAVVAQLNAESGVLTLTWSNTALLAATYPSKIRAFPRVGAGRRGFSRGGGMTARATTGSAAAKIRAFAG